ncbi:unnamed protein product, partial [Amoebophrya sp. A25]
RARSKRKKILPKGFIDEVNDPNGVFTSQGALDLDSTVVGKFLFASENTNTMELTDTPTARRKLQSNKPVAGDVIQVAYQIGGPDNGVSPQRFSVNDNNWLL